MKTLTKIAILAVMATIFAVSCKKDPGTGGKKNIKGTVTYPGGAAGGAIVKIAYGAKDTTVTEFNAEVTADGSGNYTIEKLTRGDYFIDAVYTDQYGLKYNSGGSHVLVDKKRGDVTVDLECK